MPNPWFNWKIKMPTNIPFRVGGVPEQNLTSLGKPTEEIATRYQLKKKMRKFRSTKPNRHIMGLLRLKQLTKFKRV